MTLRWHVRLHYFVASMLVGLVLFAGVLVYVVHWEIHAAKVRLKFVGHNLIHYLVEQPPPVDLEHLANHLRWADWEQNASLTLMDREGRVLAQLGEQPPDPATWQAPDGDYYAMDWAFRDFERWRYWVYYEHPAYRIILFEEGHEEVVEELLGGGAVYLTLLLVLSLVLGHQVSASILAPLQEIADTARKLRRGNLQSRIDLPPTHRELRELADNLNRTFDELQMLFNQAQDFSGSAAHELRTPLTALRGKLDVALRRERSADEYALVMGECIDDLSTLQRIVDTLLLTTRPQSDYQQEAFEDVDLVPLVSDAVAHLELLADEKELTLELDLPAAAPVRGVPVFLSQVVSNLTHNAIKFTPAGGHITVSLEPSGDWLQLRVTDTGIGLAPEHRDKIFERFYQVDSSRSQGTGLGLALVRWIVDLHNAELEVRSELGQGTAITVRLPTR